MDARAAARVLAAELPELEHLEVRRLGEGTDHWAFDVGGRYVVRFPKSELAADLLVLEARLTAWLGPQLPLPIPAYRFVCEDPALSVRPFGGYPRLEGTPGILVDPAAVDLGGIGRTLGGFLATLHHLDARRALHLGAPDESDPMLEAWAEDAMAHLEQAAEADLVDPETRGRCSRSLARRPSTAHLGAVLRHADLAAEHVLLGPSGEVTGIIDWSDASVGDGAQDLAGLLHWGGSRMLAAALERYGPIDAAVLERARWFALCRAVADLEFGQRTRRPEYVAAGARALDELLEPA